MKGSRPEAVGALLAILLAACGGATEGPAPSGRTVSSADGKVKLTFGSGSLPEGTEVSIEALPPAEVPEEVRAASPIGAVYDLRPDGLTFSAPVAVEIRLSGDDFAPTETEDGFPLAVPQVVRAGGAPEPLADARVEVRFAERSLTARGAVTHFSSLFLGRYAYVKFEPDRVTAQTFDTPFQVSVALVNRSSEPLTITEIEYEGDPPTVSFAGPPGHPDATIDVGRAAILDPPPGFQCLKEGSGAYAVGFTVVLLRTVRPGFTLFGDADCVEHALDGKG